MLVRRKLQENSRKKRTIENQRNSIDEVHVQKENLKSVKLIKTKEKA